MIHENVHVKGGNFTHLHERIKGSHTTHLRRSSTDHSISNLKAKMVQFDNKMNLCIYLNQNKHR